MASFKPIFEKMSEHYDSLLKSGLQSDVVLVAEEKELRVHKLILSTRSPVFAAMFFHDSTKEAQENRVEIVDMDAEVLELFVRYIYTGKVESLALNAGDLLIAADKYQLAILKSICVQQLLSEEITTESVSDLLFLADMYQITELITKCVEYIAHNGTEVMATEGWERIRVMPHLADKILKLSKAIAACNRYDKMMKRYISKQKPTPFEMASFDRVVFAEISVHYDSLLKSELLSDVVFVAGEKEFKVHKLILSTRSPVFAVMLAHKSTKEVEENRVEITDLDVEVLELLIKYIYTSKVDIFDNNARDLLVAADKYQLDCLKSICEQQLVSQIDSESVSNLLILADRYRAFDLHNQCLDYIIDYDNEVTASKGWKEVLMRNDLLLKIYEHVHSKFCELLNAYDGIEKIDSNKQHDIRMNWISYAKLIVVADEYQLDYLKSICEQQTLPKISAESVSDILILADMYQLTELTAKCLDYITDNGARVMTSEGWKKIVPKADLLAKLIDHLCVKLYDLGNSSV